MADPVARPVIFDNGIEQLQVDAAPRETHALTDTLTDHPVEKGANVTDHDREEPDRLTLDCVVSNTPIGSAPADDRADNAFATLLRFRKSSALLSVDTTLRLYTDMRIESLTITRDAGTSQALSFTVVLKKIRVVQNAFTRVVVARDPRAKKGKDKGDAATKPAAKDDTDELRSVGRGLSSGVKAIGGIFGGGS